MKIIINSTRKIALGIGILLILGGCSFLKNSPPASSTDESSLNSPLRAQKNLVVAENYQTTTRLDGLEHPWSMAWLPDGAILITERPGRLRIVRDGVLETQPIPICNNLSLKASCQGGFKRRLEEKLV